MKNFILIAGLMFSFSLTAQTKVVKMNAAYNIYNRRRSY